MERRNFLTAIAIGSVALVAQPILAQTKDETDLDRFLRDIDTGKIKLVKPPFYDDLFTTPKGLRWQLINRRDPNLPVSIFYTTSSTQPHGYTTNIIRFNAIGEELVRVTAWNWQPRTTTWRNLIGFNRSPAKD